MLYRTPQVRGEAARTSCSCRSQRSEDLVSPQPQSSLERLLRRRPRKLESTVEAHSSNGSFPRATAARGGHNFRHNAENTTFGDGDGTSGNQLNCKEICGAGNES
jgi:hypothetical protein